MEALRRRPSKGNVASAEAVLHYHKFTEITKTVTSCDACGKLSFGYDV